MSNSALALASILGFLALPIVVCGLRARGPHWFSVWIALAVQIAVGAWLYAGAAYFHHENNLDYRRAQSSFSELEFPATELHHILFAALGGTVFALVYYAPFALVYRAWEAWKRDRSTALGEKK